jgi:hypothetical protein
VPLHWATVTSGAIDWIRTSTGRGLSAKPPTRLGYDGDVPAGRVELPLDGPSVRRLCQLGYAYANELLA